MRTKRVRSRALALTTVAALVLTACGRSDDGTEAAEDEESNGGSPGEEASDSSLADGEFGDLGVVCQDGDASGSPDVGVTDDAINVGVINDRTSDIRPGLTQEMYDTAVAFTEWCNDNGGINGRELVLNDRDAALLEYPDRITEACDEDFALVGGGAVFDNADGGHRVECGLANIPGYVVTPDARVAEQQIQPLPNPLYEFPAQAYHRIRELDPSIERFGLIWVNFEGPKTIGDQVRETVQAEGFEIAADISAQPQNETGWPNFVRQMRDADVQVVEYVGEPEDMTKLVNAMDVEGWYPEYIVAQPNMLEQKLIDEAGESLGDGLVVRSAFAPFDSGDENQAVADYLQIMEEYNPDGKYPAMLGAQGLSAWLLFAQAATECGADLTRQCVLENAGAVDEWTAGGLHAVRDPGNLDAGTCGLIMRLTADGMAVDEELTAAEDGSLYNCAEENVHQVTAEFEGLEPPAE